MEWGIKMHILFEEEGNLEKLKSIIQKLEANEQINGIMIYTCDTNQFQETEFNSMLISMKKQVFGGIFPSIIYDGKYRDKGSIVIGFDVPVSTQIIHDMNGSFEALQIELESFCLMMGEGKTFLLNLDGMSEGIEIFKEELFYTLGLSKNYIGGGAGSIVSGRKPCVITNEGLLMDAAVIALVDVYSGIGVSHGWENVTRPVKVTESVGNRIISIDWEPALEVYQKEVENLLDKKLTLEELIDVSKGYPFGVSKLDNEMVVRDPFIFQDSSIVCVGAIPQNDFVYILTGDKESIIGGARKAKELAEEAFKKEQTDKSINSSVTLLIDCISRKQFLGDDFEEELKAIGGEGLLGALSLGEIANTGKSYLEFYNKTAVVGILEA